MNQPNVRPLVPRWRDVVVASELPRSAVQFAVVLSTRMTVGGTARIGIDKLREYAHASERTIRRARDRLRSAGLLQWESGLGRSRVTTYFAAIPGEGVATCRGFQVEIPGTSSTTTPAMSAPTPMDPGLDPENRVPHEETPADPVLVSAVLSDIRRELASKNGGRS